MQQMVPVWFPNSVGRQTRQQTETWFINMIVPAQKTRWRRAEKLNRVDEVLKQLVVCQKHDVHDVQCGDPDCSAQAVPNAWTLISTTEDRTRTSSTGGSLRQQHGNAGQRMSEDRATREAPRQNAMELA